MSRVRLNTPIFSQSEAGSQVSKANALSLRKPYLPVSYYKSFPKEIMKFRKNVNAGMFFHIYREIESKHVPTFVF